jgi:SM-20-related protein
LISRTEAFDAAAIALRTAGWCVLDGLLTDGECQALTAECGLLHELDAMLPALVGRDRSASALRGDHTRWLDPALPTAAQRPFDAGIHALRAHLNRALLLGLVDSEAHFAVYPAGAGYARHLDRLRGSDARVLSAVFYLNEAWLDSDGGALRLYLADGTHRDIFPQAGRLLLFLSAEFEHEVLAARRPRMSIACWLRQRH